VGLSIVYPLKSLQGGKRPAGRAVEPPAKRQKVAGFPSGLGWNFHEENHFGRWLSGMLKSWLPSGKHTKNYGTSPFLMDKSTINGHFQ